MKKMTTNWIQILIKIMLAMMVVSPKSYASNMTDLLARSIHCNGFPEAIGIRLASKVVGSEVQYEGNGADNYETTVFRNCLLKRDSIECKSKWNFSLKPSNLKIKQRQDGTFFGIISRPNGNIKVLGCILSHDPT